MENTPSPEIRERLKSTLNAHLAPIEHHVIGSTPRIKGQFVDVRKIIEDARSGNLSVLLTPVFLQDEGLEYKPLVVEARAVQRSERRVRGASSIDASVQVQFGREGIEIFFEPSDLDDETGQIIPEWKLYLMKGDEIIKDPNTFSRLALTSDPSDLYSHDKIFSLEFKGNDHALLKLHI